MDLKELSMAFSGLSEANRPIRLRLPQGPRVLDDVLLVKRVVGNESLCGGLEYRLQCVSMRADLPLKEFMAVPVEVQFVTDTIYATLRTAKAPGDQTVPAKSADFQLESGKFKGIFRQLGYEHQSSYEDGAALASTLYSIVRIAQHAKWQR